ncbi:transposase [Neobacillus sp. PS3-34]|uniref:transposase n=1 Tax=Neobacillus sp. PS3-34 TaxID=3070678 RepID=UPI0027E13400|nr:transposase [Neobacillus sp. PS3-34]WML46820.1 transposase [Neobacillus sp. PS3-34]
MARKRREWVPYAYHHIYSRGNNRQDLFCDETDMQEAFRLLTMIHKVTPISISAYCIMTNHYHFLLKSEHVSISKIMAAFNRRYTDYFNRKYEHVGHVFQHRFNSDPIPFTLELLRASRYIHRNPIATEPPMVARMEDYPYSSYMYYKKSITPPFPFLNLQVLSSSTSIIAAEASRLSYCRYVEEEE